MRLNRVEIHGFKSFADRTQLDFTPGLTAVVGPNGCGKSNVIDAIKWALGEQRPSALRGDEMLDVIFKGNGARAARNFAEVSLVFDNSSRSMPVEWTEVVVSRRLFRSGESEYLINRQPVRLKDIRNLFMDTGLGTGAYSIMEQGRIDAVLSADPQDRRRIFEEAAGISRYRARRRESESKLERTQHNLLRLGDVVEELEKQVRSLKQQAGRARSYLVARDRLRRLKSLYYVHRWEELGRQIEALAGEGEALVAGEAGLKLRLAAARQEAGALQEQLATARAEVDAAADAFRQVTSALEALDGRRQGLREREAETQERATVLRARLAGLEIALAERTREAGELGARLAALAAEVAGAEAALAGCVAEEASAAETLAAARSAGEVGRGLALTRAGDLTNWRNRRAEAASRLAAATATHTRVSTHSAELRRPLEEHGAVQGVLFQDTRSLEAAQAAAGKALEQKRTEHAAAVGQAERLDARLTELRESLAGSQSRCDALHEMLTRREGVSPGAITLLESGLPGVDGLVAECLRAPRELSEAVEAALGATAEAVLVRSRADALAALEHLQHNGSGRVQLLPRDALRPRSSAAAGVRLLDRVELRSDAAVLEALLGHVRLVPDRAALVACPLDGQTVWVTPQGELLDERGILRGGRVGGEGGLVTRRAECDALEAAVVALRARLDETGTERTRSEQVVAVSAQRLAEAERALRRLETDRERLAEREQHGAARQAALERDLALTERELAAADAERGTEQVARDEAAARETELDELVAADVAREAEAELARRALEEALQARRHATHEARLQLSTLTERAQALTGEERQVARAAEERRADLAHAREQLDESGAQARSLAEEQQRIEQGQAQRAEQRDVAAGALGRAKELAAEVGTRLGSINAAVAGCEQELGAASETLGAHRLRQQEVSLRRQTLREKVLEELEVDLEQERPALALLEHPGPAPAAEEGEDAEDLAAEPGEPGAPGDARAHEEPAAAGAAAPAAGDPPDWDAIEAEIEDLRERMGRMSNVNLAAVDELVQVEERLAFLVNQRDDLLAAKATLIDTISRVNKVSRERFIATFEEIREHFRQIFRKLFRGGKADISLAEGEDVLEAGIDIVAAPPGKDARSISLLSGGERTLTAVGLLFALFRAKPSPVCMLDEVDAALDETNIDRFCTVLEDFLGGSQFIVVTHARRTMSYADTLFGITMEEHGVSKAVSLTLQEYRSGDEASSAAGNGRKAARRIAGLVDEPENEERVIEQPA
jgi:chromosome segregation protein